MHPTHCPMQRRTLPAACALALGLLGALATCGSARAQVVVDVQYQRKAEMLCPLAGTLIPENVLANDAAFRIGVVGGDPFHGVDAADNPVNYLDDMVSQKGGVYKGKPIVIHRFNSVKDIQPCHILFVSSTAGGAERSAAERLAKILKTRSETPRLVVADSPGMAEAGATINFYVGTDPAGTTRVMFEINPDAAKRAGLTVKPGLLRLAARTVTDSPARTDEESR